MIDAMMLMPFGDELLLSNCDRDPVGHSERGYCRPLYDSEGKRERILWLQRQSHAG